MFSNRNLNLNFNTLKYIFRSFSKIKFPKKIPGEPLQRTIVLIFLCYYINWNISITNKYLLLTLLKYLRCSKHRDDFTQWAYLKQKSNVTISFKRELNWLKLITYLVLISDVLYSSEPKYVHDKPGLNIQYNIEQKATVPHRSLTQCLISPANLLKLQIIAPFFVTIYRLKV